MEGMATSVLLLTDKSIEIAAEAPRRLMKNSFAFIHGRRIHLTLGREAVTELEVI
jgi:hypothetical protein